MENSARHQMVGSTIFPDSPIPDVRQNCMMIGVHSVVDNVNGSDKNKSFY